MFIGYYNKSVVLTYVGLFFAICAMNLGIRGEFSYALILLLAASVCDLFDGTVANLVERDDEEKKFGIELDSLNDMIIFCATPIVIATAIGFNGILSIFVFTFFGIASISRLGYFNINAEVGVRTKCYTGVPVFLSAPVIPLFYLIFKGLNGTHINIIFGLAFVVTGFLYISKIPVKKPSVPVGIGIIIGEIILVILLFLNR